MNDDDVEARHIAFDLWIVGLLRLNRGFVQRIEDIQTDEDAKDLRDARELRRLGVLPPYPEPNVFPTLGEYRRWLEELRATDGESESDENDNDEDDNDEMARVAKKAKRGGEKRASDTRRRSARLQNSGDEGSDRAAGQSDGELAMMTGAIDIGSKRKLVTPFAKLKKDWPAAGRRFSEEDMEMDADEQQDGQDNEDDEGAVGSAAGSIDPDDLAWRIPHLRRLHEDDVSDLRLDDYGNPAKARMAIRRETGISKLKEAVVIIERVAGDTEAMPFVDREFHVLPSQKAMGELAKREPERVLRWRMTDEGIITPRAIDPKGGANRDVAILQTRGELAVRECSHCAGGNGPFSECVVAPEDAAGQQQGHGACANCQWGNKGARCSLNRKQAYGKAAETMTLGAFVPGFSKAKEAEAAGKKMRPGKAASVMEVSDDEDPKTPTPRKRPGAATSLVKRKRVKISEEAPSSSNTPDKRPKVSLGGRSSLGSGEYRFLPRPETLKKDQLESVVAARKDIRALGEFVDAVQTAHAMVGRTQHFHLPGEVRLEDIVDGSVTVEVDLWEKRLAAQEKKLREPADDDDW
ncbi:hypothetical protein GX51_08331 [Blastomyces parvus]|uniref:Uncharacterized protein n=1 Tax=Blastomyces parvus TaxID=2060905 RepID=A0A2B7WES7_9EURO|nr:hypothetical protein GX51_08331 [Blastomyces parvus]